jgi:quercetin dioxygenase-like cupin family protein
MAGVEIKRFSAPDEVRPFQDRGRAEVLTFEGVTIGRGFFEPGWRWSEHVKPIAGTESCRAHHTLYVVTGRMRIVADDGQEREIHAGDVVVIPPGHDAYTVGDETCVLLDFSGFDQYAVARAGGSKQAPEPQPSP